MKGNECVYVLSSAAMHAAAAGEWSCAPPAPVQASPVWLCGHAPAFACVDMGDVSTGPRTIASMCRRPQLQCARARPLLLGQTQAGGRGGGAARVFGGGKLYMPVSPYIRTDLDLQPT